MPARVQWAGDLIGPRIPGKDCVMVNTRSLGGIAIDNCGCFGVYFARPLTPYTLVEDLVLLGLPGALWLQVRG